LGCLEGDRGEGEGEAACGACRAVEARQILSNANSNSQCHLETYRHDVTTLTITAGPRGVYHTQVLPQEGSLSEGDGVSLPSQVDSTSEGVKLNTSSEKSALDTKTEGAERGEIRVDGG
jgi:hypothetical protein